MYRREIKNHQFYRQLIELRYFANPMISSAVLLHTVHSRLQTTEDVLWQYVALQRSDKIKLNVYRWWNARLVWDDVVDILIWTIWCTVDEAHRHQFLIRWATNLRVSSWYITQIRNANAEKIIINCQLKLPLKQLFLSLCLSSAYLLSQSLQSTVSEEAIDRSTDQLLVRDRVWPATSSFALVTRALQDPV